MQYFVYVHRLNNQQVSRRCTPDVGDTTHLSVSKLSCFQFFYREKKSLGIFRTYFTIFGTLFNHVYIGLGIQMVDKYTFFSGTF